MVCELNAAADSDGYLCLHLRSPHADEDWLSCELRGERVVVKSASGRQLVSAQTALRLLLRELFLRELSLLGLGASDLAASGLDARGLHGGA